MLDPTLADLRLWAAAPDLLNALKGILTYLVGNPASAGSFPKLVEAAESAIAKTEVAP